MNYTELEEMKKYQCHNIFAIKNKKLYMAYKTDKGFEWKIIKNSKLSSYFDLFEAK